MTITSADYEAYAGTKAILSTKTEIYVKNPEDDMFVRVGMVVGVPSMSDGERPTVDVTNLSSEFVETIDGLSDPNSDESSFTCHYGTDDAGQRIVESAYSGQYKGQALDFEIRMPFYNQDGTTRATASFGATVSNSNVIAAPNEALQLEVSLKKTTLVTKSWVI